MELELTVILVFRAIDNDLHRRILVDIKILQYRPTPTSDQSFLENLLRNWKWEMSTILVSKTIWYNENIPVDLIRTTHWILNHYHLFNNIFAKIRVGVP